MSMFYKTAMIWTKFTKWKIVTTMWRYWKENGMFNWELHWHSVSPDRRNGTIHQQSNIKQISDIRHQTPIGESRSIHRFYNRHVWVQLRSLSYRKIWKKTSLILKPSTKHVITYVSVIGVGFDRSLQANLDLCRFTRTCPSLLTVLD